VTLTSRHPPFNYKSSPNSSKLAKTSEFDEKRPNLLYSRLTYSLALSLNILLSFILSNNFSSLTISISITLISFISFLISFLNLLRLLNSYYIIVLEILYSNN